MKKTKTLATLMSLLVAGSFLLTACGGDSSTVESSIDEETSEVESSVEESSEESQYPEAIVTLRTDSEVELEVGGKVTIAGRVTTDESDSTLNISVDDPTVISLPTKTSGAASYSITGLKEGTCTVTLSANVNPEAYVTVAVTVIAARPALASAIETVSNYTNYTITAEGNYYSSSGSSVPYTAKKECVSNALVVGIDYGNQGEYSAMYTSSSTGYDMWGIFAAQDGYCSYLYYDEDTMVTEGLERVKGNDGYLTADTIAGNHYKNYNSANSYFNGLQALNSDLFTSTKASDNVYEIEGGSSSTTDTNAECMLLAVFDDTMYYNAVTNSVDSSGYYYLSDVAELVDTTITVLDDDHIQVDFAMTIGTYEYASTALISNIGTTALDVGPSTMAEDIAAVQSIAAPALDSRLQLVIDAVAADNYVLKGNYYRSSPYYVEYSMNIYYSKNYCAYVLDQTNYDKFISAGYTETYMNSINAVYFITDDSDYIQYAYINYDYVTQDDGSEVFTVTADFDNVETTTRAKSTFYTYNEYLSSTGMFTEEMLTQLGDYATFFTSMNEGFWTTGETLSQAYAEALGVWSSMESDYPDRLGSDVFGIVPSFNDNYTEVIGFTLVIGFSPEGNGSYYTYSWAYSDVGNATGQCPINGDWEEYTNPTEEENTGSAVSLLGDYRLAI